MFFCGNYDDLEKLVTKLAPRKEKYGDLNIFSRFLAFGARFATHIAFTRGGTRALVLAEAEAEAELKVDAVEAGY